MRESLFRRYRSGAWILQLRLRIPGRCCGLRRDPGFVCFRNPAGAGLRSRKAGFMQHHATVVASGRMQMPGRRESCKYRGAGSTPRAIQSAGMSVRAEDVHSNLRRSCAQMRSGRRAIADLHRDMRLSGDRHKRAESQKLTRIPIGGTMTNQARSLKELG